MAHPATKAATEVSRRWTIASFLRACAVAFPLGFFDPRQLAGISTKQINSETRVWVFKQILSHDVIKGQYDLDHLFSAYRTVIRTDTDTDDEKGKLTHSIHLIQRPDKDKEYSSLKVPWAVTLKSDYLCIPKGLDQRLQDSKQSEFLSLFCNFSNDLII